MPEAAFDHSASLYDSRFTHTAVGRLQRERVWECLRPILDHPVPLDILEINCGTGEDARFMASYGHHVTATDISENMINISRNKHIDNVEFKVCSFDKLFNTFKNQRFDLVFSDFGGVNCVDRNGVRKLQEDMHRLLKPGGRLAVVVLGKYCLLERMYFIAKGRWKDVNRRLGDGLPAKIDAGQHQDIWYYSSAEMRIIMKDFECVKRRPVGLFIPPSYLNPTFERFGWLRTTLLTMERLFGTMPLLTDLADHAYIEFKARP